MRRLFGTTALAFLVALTCAPGSYAWDVTYNGSVLPNSSLLGSAVWQEDSNNYLGACSTQNGILHLVDQSTAATARFYREGSMNLPAGTDVTIETRGKVVSSTSPYGPDYSGVGFGFSTGSGGGFLALWPDKLSIMYGGSNYQTFYSLDMTQFHTIKMAMTSSDRNVTVWVDGVQALSGRATGGNNKGGIQFGTTSVPGATSDSYWDYLSYTIPEPSSLLALLAGLGGFALRRKRN